jgi:DNA polymerase-4
MQASRLQWEADRKCPKPDGRLPKAGPDGGPARGRTVTLKLKSHEHETGTRQTTLGRAVAEKEELMALVRRLLLRPQPPSEPVRLLGISVSSLTSPSSRIGEQLELEFP